MLQPGFAAIGICTGMLLFASNACGQAYQIIEDESQAVPSQFSIHEQSLCDDFVGDTSIGNVNPKSVFENEPPISRRPPVGLGSEWITDSETGLVTGEANVTLPLLLFDGPPPLIKIGFSYTDLFAAPGLGLSPSLYEYSASLSWVRPINERWTIRSILGVAMATDNQNTSSDAWQFRGGVFAILDKNDQWIWTFGAVATGRDDLPVLPAVGAVVRPNPAVRVDLIFPQPKVNFLLTENGSRQQWAFLGAGINGDTWAYETSALVNDRLTYSDLRVVVGWESRPTASAGMPFAIGRTMRAELGYVFSREFEFEDETRTENLNDALMFGISTRF